MSNCRTAKGRFKRCPTGRRARKSVCRPATLQKRIQKILDDHRKDMDAPAGSKWDPFSDVGFWSAAQAKAKNEDYGADLVMHFDGGGFDLLSINGELAMYGSYTFRDQIDAVAKACGYYNEDIHSWSMGFYRE